MAGCRVDGGARADGLAEAASIGVRGASRLLAARSESRAAQLPRAGYVTGELRKADGLHAHRAVAADGASVFRLVGLPGDRLLRANRAIRHARRFHAPGGSLPP